MRVPLLRNHRYVEPWTNFEHGDLSLTAANYEHTDGRHHVYFWLPGEDIRGRELSRDVTRVAYRQWGEAVLFLGMSIEFSLRGSGLGEKLVQYFTREVEKHDTTFIGTGIIYKPLIALTLNRVGLQPESSNYMAEILPRSNYDSTPEIPKIQMVTQPKHCDNLPSESRGGRFYDRISPEDVLRTYPINNPDMTVAINTCYLPKS